MTPRCNYKTKQQYTIHMHVFCKCFLYLLYLSITYPRDPGSPKLRMVSWNLNTIRFVEVIMDTPTAHPLTFGDLNPRDKEHHPPKIGSFTFTNSEWTETEKMHAQRLHFYHGLVPFLGVFSTEMEASWKGSDVMFNRSKKQYIHFASCIGDIVVFFAHASEEREICDQPMSHIRICSHRCSNLKSKFTKETRKEHNNHNCWGHNREGQSIKGPFKCSLNNNAAN